LKAKIIYATEVAKLSKDELEKIKLLSANKTNSEVDNFIKQIEREINNDK
jgi:hypothetical protein